MGEIALLKEKKRILREDILRRRSMLEAKMVEDKSLAIACKLFALREFADSRIVMCYMAFRNEVDCGQIMQHCYTLGKRVALPLIARVDERSVKPCKDGKRILAIEVEDPENGLEKGTYGIFEPRRVPEKEINPRDIDLVIVPGVVFDQNKNRIGYGAGYYDRFLRDTREDCRKIGVAFEMQVVDRVPADHFDVPLDMIITECRIIY